MRENDLKMPTEGVPDQFKNDPRHDHQEKDAYEAVTFQDGQTGAGNGAEDIKNHHGQGELKKNTAVKQKEKQGSQVGGKVDHLGRGGGGQKGITKKADKDKNEETAGAGAKKAIVKTDEGAGGQTKKRELAGAEMDGLDFTKILLKKDVNSNEN